MCALSCLLLRVDLRDQCICFVSIHSPTLPRKNAEQTAFQGVVTNSFIGSSLIYIKKLKKKKGRVELRVYNVVFSTDRRCQMLRVDDRSELKFSTARESLRLLLFPFLTQLTCHTQAHACLNQGLQIINSSWMSFCCLNYAGIHFVYSYGVFTFVSLLYLKIHTLYNNT